MRTIFKLPVNVLAVIHDSVMAGLSFALALYLRIGSRAWTYGDHFVWPGALGFAIVLLAVLLYYRTYRRVWRYTSLNDLFDLARAGTLALLIFYVGLFLFTRLEVLPRSVPFIHWMTLMLCLSAARVFQRIYHDRAVISRILGSGASRVPVLLIGATSQAALFIRESERNANFPYFAAGIVDDDERQHGRAIHHVRIYGGIDDIERVLDKLVQKGKPAQRLLLTEANVPRATYEKLLVAAEAHNLTIARLPSLGELQAGEALHQLRPIAMEDVLGRPQAVLDREAMHTLVHGRRVLITGAGGSIGSELTRQIAANGPAQLLLFDSSEYLLYLIDHELEEQRSPVPRRSVIGDVRDAGHLSRVFSEFRPEIVFHAAAIKHVPLSEANPDQAVLTNILGSKQVADACVEHSVAAMVQVSTDKAVNPASIMGATKRAAEIYCQALAQEGAVTRFITVRFGNVLNSAGSVVPLFQKQLARGGPITVTHRDMTRYFMTIGEAVQLILQAAALGVRPGEVEDGARIYVLDMGEPVRILALAEQIIRLAGLQPYKDIDIVFTGVRPGEKIHEELFHGGESLLATSHKSIRLARARALERRAVLKAIDHVITAAGDGKRSAIPRLLKAIVPESQLSES